MGNLNSLKQFSSRGYVSKDKQKPVSHSQSRILGAWGCRSLAHVGFCSLRECFLGRAGLSVSKVCFTQTRPISLNGESQNQLGCPTITPGLPNRLLKHVIEGLQRLTSTTSLTQRAVFAAYLSPFSMGGS